MNAASFVMLFATLASGQGSPGDLHYDLRGGGPLPGALRLIGPECGTLTHAEADGFRITLPPSRAGADRVGLELLPLIKGDFAITAKFEILNSDEPMSGYGLGFELMIRTAATAKAEELGAYPVARPREGDVFMVSRNSTIAGKGDYRQKRFPSSCRSGQLRISRTGSEATIWAAEGDSTTFRKLCRYDLGPEDINRIWLTAFPGHTRHMVDVRILELDIHSGSAIEVATLEPPLPMLGDPPPKSAGRSWLVAGIILGIASPVLLVLGVRLFLRRRHDGALTTTAATFKTGAPNETFG